MADLTPEEKTRIYQEEKARIEAQTKIKNAENKKNTRTGCLALVVIIIAIGLWIGFSIGGTEIKGPSSIDAYVMSQKFVEDRLKTPSTAKFPTYKEEMVVQLNDNRFKVSAYVDAQNTFGATIRTHYTCWVKNTSGDRWSLENIELNE